MSNKIEIEGECLRCAKKTLWFVSEGWVFHSFTRHWRCSICFCATQPQLFLSPRIVEKIKNYECAGTLEIEIEV